MNFESKTTSIFTDEAGWKLKPIPNLDSKALPEFLTEFYKHVGTGIRNDNFIFIVNPIEHYWVSELFGIRDMYMFARNSFDTLYFADKSELCFEFSAAERDLGKFSTDFELGMLSLNDKDFTDDDIIYKRHVEMQERGNLLSKDECYCFSPALPLGGDEETSDIYIGNFKSYMTLLSQM